VQKRQKKEKKNTFTLRYTPKQRIVIILRTEFLDWTLFVTKTQQQNAAPTMEQATDGQNSAIAVSVRWPCLHGFSADRHYNQL
jgi:hypothetical protein